MVLLANLLWSRYGRAFRAVRDDEIAASLAGIHVARTKVMAFAISAGCAGLGGALLGLSTGVVNTGEFPLTLSIQLLAAMVLGGTGHADRHGVGRRSCWCTCPQWSTSLSGDFNLGSGANAYLATIIFGVVLIVAMIAAPNGIQGGLRWAVGPRAAPRRRSGAAAAPSRSMSEQSDETQRNRKDRRRSDAKNERGDVNGWALHGPVRSLPVPSG